METRTAVFSPVYHIRLLFFFAFRFSLMAWLLSHTMRATLKRHGTSAIYSTVYSTRGEWAFYLGPHSFHETPNTSLHFYALPFSLITFLSYEPSTYCLVGGIPIS